MKAIEFNGDGKECDDYSNTLKGIFHLDGTGADYTLCGETLDGDSLTAGSFAVVDVKSINCPECVSVIKACRNVKTSST